MHRPHDAGQRQLMTASVRLPIEVPNSRAEIGRAHVLNSSHSQISYAAFCLKKKGNLPPREISMKDVFRSADSSKKFKIAEGQWYRYAPSYVSPAYHFLAGFPFIQEPPSGDLQERVLIRHHDYDQCFQSVQLLQWNSQVKFNVTVYRNLPTTRDSIMTS